MSISLKTHKILWGKAGSKCSFPGCNLDLVVDETETDDTSIIGEEAHIVSKKEDGPRGKSTLSEQERDKYDNLILMCRIHHKLIDDQEKEFTIEKLHNYKSEHEKWISKNLSVDKTKEREDLVYADYIDRFIELAEVNNWKVWTSQIFNAGQPCLYSSNSIKLRELLEFIISRVWFGRYPNLERAFFNFKLVAEDFLVIFEKYSQLYEKDNKDEEYLIRTIKFYKGRHYEQNIYHDLLKKYEYHCFLVEDLALEMTRAANHLIDQVRNYLFPSFRINEGVLLISIGPFSDLRWETIRIEYKHDEKEELYPGLRKFMEIRKNRSYSRDEGINNDYFLRR
jgi:hypothetical protein